MWQLTVKRICLIYLLKTYPKKKITRHTGVRRGNNRAVSLPKINRAFNTVIKPQSEIWLTVVGWDSAPFCSRVLWSVSGCHSNGCLRCYQELTISFGIYTSLVFELRPRNGAHCRSGDLWSSHCSFHSVRNDIFIKSLSPAPLHRDCKSKSEKS